MTAALTAYRLALGLAEPLAPLLLRGRLAKGKEDPERIGERLGHAGLPRPAGPLVWMHGVSVGETVSLLPLIDRLRAERPDVAVLMTSGTPASAQMMARRLPPGVIHQYAPVDTPRAVRRFLDHWRPDLGLFTESEIWPNLILEAKARGTRLALISARITRRTADGWRRHAGAAKAVFGAFDLALPQDDASAERLRALGAAPGPVLNLKLAGAPLPVDRKALAAVKRSAEGRPILLAASTHPGDETAVLDAVALDALTRAKRDGGGLLVIAPRHVERGPAIADLVRERGLAVTLRSRGEPVGVGHVHVADTLGELGTWFRAARVAYIGGGLSSQIGGHNPLEAARLDCPVISGPEVANWDEVYTALEAVDAVTFVEDAPQLATAFGEALDDPAAGAARAARARALTDGQAAALDAGWAALTPLLPERA